jgi:hypothetical protein
VFEVVGVLRVALDAIFPFSPVSFIVMEVVVIVVVGVTVILEIAFTNKQ